MTTATALRTITAEDLYIKMTGEDHPIVINALNEEAYTAKHIPGSINIPTENAELIENVVPYKEAEIVVYCANSDCDASPQLAEKLEDMGYTNVMDFEDGLAGWKQAGYELAGSDA